MAALGRACVGVIGPTRGSIVEFPGDIKKKKNLVLLFCICFK